MLRKSLFLIALLSATTAMAAAQNFLLDIDNTQAIPVGPLVNGVANISTGTDSQGNLYVLANGLVQGPYVYTIGPQPLGPLSYLVKLNPAGAVLYQNTLPSLAVAMVVDPAGNVYLAGGNSIEKLGPDGKTVLYNTVIGGPSLGAAAMALDSTGRVYATGSVGAGDLPATPGAFQQTAQTASGFVVRLNAAGGIDYATYLGVAVNNPYGIAVDSSGSAVVMWSTQSTDFPATPGAYLASGLSMLARLTPDGSGLIYSTFAGGPLDTAYYVAVDSAGNAVVALSDRPGYSASVVRFNTEGTGVAFSKTFPIIGPGGLAVDASGNTYVYNPVFSYTGNYPVKNSLSACGTGTALTVIDSSGAIVQSTYLPGGQSPIGIHVLPDSTVDLFGMPSTGGLLSMIQLSQNPQAQTVQLACFGNAGSYDDAVISPGEIVSLFGSGLGPAAGTQPQIDIASGFPTKVADVQVTFNGTPGPLLYVQDGQINAIAPWSLGAGQQVQVCVVYNGSTTNCLNADVETSHPGVFMVTPALAAALNQDGTLNSASNPAKVGSVVSIFATGLGAIDPPQRDGSIVGFPLPANDLPVSMYTISPTGGSPIPITVLYAGPAPGEVAGVSQINFTVDANVGGPYETFVAVGLPDNQVVTNGFSIYVAQ
jgi:uncharacterized protein (TIGR03437 family)